MAQKGDQPSPLGQLSVSEQPSNSAARSWVFVPGWSIIVVYP